ncbi:MAG TPA: J domain-containing protein [Candidatus Nanoarchaeia archaeon]|nr:J domain-containing protein [Candidatus Nanoarchaeia archaeon]
MFDSFKKHPPEKLEKLLRQYSNSKKIRAAQRILKRNKYQGLEDLEVLSFASNIHQLSGDNETAQDYARRGINEYSPRSNNADYIVNLAVLPQLQLSQSELEKVLPLLFAINPTNPLAKFSATTKPTSDEEAKVMQDYIKLSRAAGKRPLKSLKKIRKIRSQLQFLQNNDYLGNDVDTLVQLSNLYYEINYGIERMVSLGLLSTAGKEVLTQYFGIAGDIEELKDTAIAYAEKAFDYHYSSPEHNSGRILYHKLTSLFSTTKAHPTSIYDQKISQMIPKEVFRVLDFLAERTELNYANDSNVGIDHEGFERLQTWTIDKVLAENPKDLEILKLAAQMECNYSYRPITTRFDEDTYLRHRRRAIRFYQKIYAQTKNRWDVKLDLWKELGIMPDEQPEQQNRYGGENNCDYKRYNNYYKDFFEERNFRFVDFQAGSFDDFKKFIDNILGQNQNKHQPPPLPSTTSKQFAILGIPPTASFEEAQVAYRLLAKQYHPDRNPSSKDAEDRMKQINGAWKYLRQHYKH